MKVPSRIKIFDWKVKQLTDAQIKALEETADLLRRDIMDAKVMPYDTGNLQDFNTFVDFSKSKNGLVSLISQTPYARRLYFHPEYNFRKDRNPNAQGKWLEPWISGDKKEWCQETFKKFYKQFGGV
jgi:hypothetical protein